MCARFTLKSGPSALLSAFAQLDLGDNWASSLPQPRYNIAPSQPLATIMQVTPQGLQLQLMTWGLEPARGRRFEASGGPGRRRPLINARVETAATIPSFRDAFRTRRCLILADGFYEWRKHGGGVTPMYASMHDGRPFVIAGLWQPAQIPSPTATAIGPEMSTASNRPTCALLTTQPNALMRPIHDRMPVILPTSLWQSWLSHTPLSVDERHTLARPFSAETMVVREVSPWVNRVRNDGPRCVEPALRRD